MPYDKFQDPWGIAMWPRWPGRDGCRTPLPWHLNHKHAGFSEADQTWLPMPNEHHELCIEAQEKDSNSVLNFTRAFLSWRKDQPALIDGDIEFHDYPDQKVLSFTRYNEHQEILCIFNLGEDEKIVNLNNVENLRLQPFEAFFASSTDE